MEYEIKKPSNKPFAVALGIGWFVLGLKTGWSFSDQSEEQPALEAINR